MGIITLSIDDELERQVRERISQTRGFSKGALSDVFEEAIRVWLSGRPSNPGREMGSRFRAVLDKKVIAEALTLNELSKKLKESKIDPRDVQILSSAKRDETRRLGMRTFGRREIGKMKKGI